LYQLMPHQTDLVTRCRQSLRQGKRRPLIVVPTGGGKTLLAAIGMIRPAAEAGKRVWFVVPKTALVDQTSTKLQEIGVEHGVIQANHWRTNYSKRVQVISKDTMAARIKKTAFAAPDLIIWDEAHHLTDDNGYGKISAAFEASIQIGLTATPIRLDGRGMGEIFDDLIVGPSINDMIAQRILIPSLHYSWPLDTSSLRRTAFDYNQKDTGEMMGQLSIRGNLVREYLAKASGRRAIGFATTVDNSESYAAIFNEAGIASASITQKTPPDERRRLIADLSIGRLMVLWSVGVFTEGFDCPTVDAVIFARPTKSLQLYIQMAGRGLRAALGPGRAVDGEHCVFLDHAGLKHEHGFVTDERDWTLAGKSRGDGVLESRHAYKCPHCSTELRGWPSMCPECGGELRPEQREENELALEDTTELVLMSADEKCAVAAERQEFYRQIEDACYLTGEPAWRPGVIFKMRYKEFPKAKDRETSAKRVVFQFNLHTQKHEAIWKSEEKATING
jgi:DNA repair protein RadD